MYKTNEVICVCCKCKREFPCKALGRTELEANFKLRDMLNRSKCPDCIKESIEARALAIAEEYNLPHIVGYTDKQIAFAFSLRSRYVAAHFNEIKYVREELEKIDPAKIKNAAEKRGLEPADCVEQAFAQIGALKPYICAVESSAPKIIEVLNNKV